MSGCNEQDHKTDADWQQVVVSASSDAQDCPSTSVTEKEEATETRALPTGWCRQFDEETKRYFYYDSTARPLCLLWKHPMDDDSYLKGQKGSNTLDGNKNLGRGSEAIAPPNAFILIFCIIAEHMLNLFTWSTRVEREESRKQREQKEALKKAKEEERKRMIKEKEEEDKRRREKKEEDFQRAKEEGKRKVKETGMPLLIGWTQGGKQIWAQPVPPGYPWIEPSIGTTPFIKPSDYCVGPGWETPIGFRNALQGQAKAE